MQPKLAGSPYSGFLSKFDSTGSTLLFSTYYGLLSHISPPRVDAQGNIWLSGATTDAGSLVLAPNSVVLGNSLIAEIAPDASRVLFSALLPDGAAVFSVADSAVNGVTGTVAPGEFLSIYGTGPTRDHHVLSRPSDQSTGTL